MVLSTRTLVDTDRGSFCRLGAQSVLRGYVKRQRKRRLTLSIHRKVSVKPAFWRRMLAIMPAGKYRGRLKGIAIRRNSVRQARLEAGLSLAQVAAGKVSRTAIHYIETGRSLPSLETLRLIAHQTGKPIEFFFGASGAASEMTDAQEDVSE